MRRGEPHAAAHDGACGGFARVAVGRDVARYEEPHQDEVRDLASEGDRDRQPEDGRVRYQQWEQPGEQRAHAERAGFRDGAERHAARDRVVAAVCDRVGHVPRFERTRAERAFGAVHHGDRGERNRMVRDEESAVHRDREERADDEHRARTDRVGEPAGRDLERDDGHRVHDHHAPHGREVEAACEHQAHVHGHEQPDGQPAQRREVT